MSEKAQESMERYEDFLVERQNYEGDPVAQFLVTELFEAREELRRASERLRSEAETVQVRMQNLMDRLDRRVGDDYQGMNSLGELQSHGVDVFAAAVDAVQSRVASLKRKLEQHLGSEDSQI